MFYKYMLVIALALSSFGAMAQSTTVNPCDNIAEVTSQMTQNEVSTLLKTCRNGGTTSTITQKNVSKLAPAAKGIAEAIGIAAKELGIATNDFLKSPAGFLVAALLIFNFGGGLIFCVAFSVISFLIASMTILRLRIASCEFESVPVLWGAFSIRRVKSAIAHKDYDNMVGFMMFCVMVLALLLNALVWFNIT